jgi:hypothetical protein
MKSLTIKIFAVAITAISLTGCMGEDRAKRALDAAGMTDVRIEGKSWFGCSKGDVTSRNFTATTASGEKVSGQVCGGWFKGATVRID